MCNNISIEKKKKRLIGITCSIFIPGFVAMKPSRMSFTANVTNSLLLADSCNILWWYWCVTATAQFPLKKKFASFFTDFFLYSGMLAFFLYFDKRPFLCCNEICLQLLYSVWCFLFLYISIKASLENNGSLANVASSSTKWIMFAESGSLKCLHLMFWHSCSTFL